ncbi:MAG: NUDIX hydrolase [Parcubacteria group bacterium GW2011_GWA1_36_12]|nr:MAG: NUDIX hydrolase [Parcubacteria group bacterium GW2011_GWA1_36_12]
MPKEKSAGAIIFRMENSVSRYLLLHYPAMNRKGEKPAWIFKLVTFFVAETKTKDIKLSPEHIGYLWLPYEEALKKITYKNSKELLKKANSYILKNQV